MVFTYLKREIERVKFTDGGGKTQKLNICQFYCINVGKFPFLCNPMCFFPLVLVYNLLAPAYISKFEATFGSKERENNMDYWGNVLKKLSCSQAEIIV
jgi:hypothetical protein